MTSLHVRCVAIEHMKTAKGKELAVNVYEHLSKEGAKTYSYMVMDYWADDIITSSEPEYDNFYKAKQAGMEEVYGRYII